MREKDDTFPANAKTRSWREAGLSVRVGHGVV